MLIFSKRKRVVAACRPFPRRRLIGFVRGKLSNVGLIKSELEVVAVGAVSGIGGYFLGACYQSLSDIRTILFQELDQNAGEN